MGLLTVQRDRGESTQCSHSRARMLCDRGGSASPKLGMVMIAVDRCQHAVHDEPLPRALSPRPMIGQFPPAPARSTNHFRDVRNVPFALVYGAAMRRKSVAGADPECKCSKRELRLEALPRTRTCKS